MRQSVIKSTDLCHSSRGNQQFNHYPVKLPTTNVCQFVQNLYTDYLDYLEDMYNIADEGECPIAPRFSRQTCERHLMSR
ncbi:uncharacterized protein LOC118509963 [Anopheles stephensi]|uniref:uncharacterized protein LOC118509963 n=1 Tax=Anopheles stephensi TaxID=30069 RepID=UPI001658A512|nr:uncharacterized protein LOC118509963 [Anopheles stephensi]